VDCDVIVQHLLALAQASSVQISLFLLGHWARLIVNTDRHCVLILDGQKLLLITLLVSAEHAPQEEMDGHHQEKLTVADDGGDQR